MLKIQSGTLRAIAIVGAVYIAVLGGGTAFAMNAMLERSKVSKVHWVVPYQTACIETEQVKVTLWDYHTGPSHRDFEIAGTHFRLSGKIGQDDSVNCPTGVIVSLRRS